MGEDEDAIFSDGFESGDVTGWPGSFTSAHFSKTVESGVKNSGTYACDFNNDGAGVGGVYLTDDTSGTDIYARGYYLFNTAFPTAGNKERLTIFEAAGNSYVINVIIYNDGGTMKWGLEGTGVAQTLAATPNPVLDHWYCVELHWKSNTVAELWVDGNLLVSVAHSTSYTITLEDFGIGYCYNGYAHDIYLDDCVIDTSYIGPISTGSELKGKLLVTRPGSRSLKAKFEPIHNVSVLGKAVIRPKSGRELTLWVDGLGSEHPGWIRVGDSPYLNAISDDSRVVDATRNAEIGDFTFENTSAVGVPTHVDLSFYVKKHISNGNKIEVYLDDGLTEQVVGYITPEDSYGWKTIDVTSILSTFQKVNDVKMKMKAVAI